MPINLKQHHPTRICSRRILRRDIPQITPSIHRQTTRIISHNPEPQGIPQIPTPRTMTSTICIEIIEQ
jgi:hypothetical protein